MSEVREGGKSYRGAATAVQTFGGASAPAVGGPARAAGDARRALDPLAASPRADEFEEAVATPARRTSTDLHDAHDPASNLNTRRAGSHEGTGAAALQPALATSGVGEGDVELIFERLRRTDERARAALLDSWASRPATQVD